MSFGQGGAPWEGTGGPSGTPDWQAMAEESERRRTRRRRWLLAGVAALATALVAGVVAFSVLRTGGSPTDGPPDRKPGADGGPAGVTESQPTFQTELPPAPPEDYLRDPAKDTAPLTTRSLFPGATVKVNGRTYTRVATDSTDDCASATQGGLGRLLEERDCRQVLRATYQREGLAFTVGIAVLGSEDAAKAVRKEYAPNIAALPGGEIRSYCRTVQCRTTVNALGRYALFSIAGPADNTPAGDDHAAAKQTALDGSHFGYARLLSRGQEQAEADARTGS